MPYPDFNKSARCLDMRRLGKQRVECLQILNVLCLNPESRWRNHPTILMWKGYERALKTYGVIICEEWKKRGYKDTCREKILSTEIKKDYMLPNWFGLETFHKSHQSNLVRKFPEHYKNFFPNIENDLPYFWPKPFIGE